MKLFKGKRGLAVLLCVVSTTSKVVLEGNVFWAVIQVVLQILKH